MVDFVTNNLPQETRLSIDDRYLKLYPASDGMMHNEDNIQLDAVIAAIIQIDEFVDFPFSIHPPARQDDIWTTSGATASIWLVAPREPVVKTPILRRYTAIDWHTPVSSAAKSSLCWQTLAKRSDRISRVTLLRKLAIRPTNWAAV